MPDKPGNILTDKIPARVQALADQVGDQVVAWNEKEDGSVVIVFNSKGKQTFEKIEFEKFIHTKAEAEQVVKTLPHHKKGK